jgi:hypothetical protein
VTRAGTLEYTDRAHSQDASDALRGDIVRGLVELITNADDAYVRAGQESGSIRVVIEHLDDSSHSARVTVADSATGMTADQMQAYLTRLGVRSSSFDTGESVRGLHGRGARDLAVFGSIDFESVRDDRYSCLSIAGVHWQFTAEDVDATPELRARLGLADGQNGLRAVVHVKRPFSVAGEVGDRLSRHAELRHILAEREVTILECGMRDVPLRRLVYDPPGVTGDLVEAEVEIPGYEGHTAVFHVQDLKEPEAGSVGLETHHGILIRGGRAIYQNTLFELESRPGASYLCGEFTCPLIDQLVREFDDTEEAGASHAAENPFRLLTRSRDGLVPTHPLTKRIRALFAATLLPIIQGIEARHSGNRGPSEALQRRLDQAARELARLLADDLAELDEEVGGDGDDIAALRVIPSRVSIRPHERKTLTVHVRPDQLDEDWNGEFDVRNDAPHVVELLGEPDALAPHPYNVRLLISRIRLSALETEGSAVLNVSAGAHATSATVRVDAQTPPPLPAPETLEFSHESYSVRALRRRSFEIAAPLDLVTAHGDEVHVVLEGDPGITLLTEQCRLRLDDNLGWYRGRISVHGGPAGSMGSLTAALGDAEATARLTVVEPTDPGGLDLRFEWQDSKQGALRASLVPEPEGLKLVIFGRHPAIAGLLGRWDDDVERFQNDDSAEVGLVLSEIVASELAHHILERDFARPGRSQLDAGTYAANYRRRLDRYLAVAQRLMSLRD